MKTNTNNSIFWLRQSGVQSPTASVEQQYAIALGVFTWTESGIDGYDRKESLETLCDSLGFFEAADVLGIRQHHLHHGTPSLRHALLPLLAWT